jgi:hypothetical protein
MSIIRQAVAREIRRKKLTGYGFAQSMKGSVHPVTIMKWLYSGHRVSVTIVEQVLDALGLVIVPKADLKSNGGARKKTAGKKKKK